MRHAGFTEGEPAALVVRIDALRCWVRREGVGITGAAPCVKYFTTRHIWSFLGQSSSILAFCKASI